MDLDLDAVTVSQRRSLASGLGIDWSQETDTVTLYLPLAAGMRGRDLDVRFGAELLTISRRGTNGEVLLTGTLGGRCDPSESEWEVKDGELVVVLRKAKQREWLHPLQPKAPLNAVSAGGVAGQTSVSANAKTSPDIVSAAAALGPSPPPPRPVPSGGVVAASDGGGSLSNAYRSWDQFDDIGALTAMENEGKSADEPGWSLRSSAGVASVQCTDYVKDKEEVRADQTASLVPLLPATRAPALLSPPDPRALSLDTSPALCPLHASHAPGALR